MNEIQLSNNLQQIELEINHHKNLAGQSIWEIGRRLNHVKENDLVHGEFRTWHNELGIDKDFASKSMKIAKELPNVETLRHLGTTALNLIATIPEQERSKEHTTSKGEMKKPDEMTVRNYDNTDLIEERKATVKDMQEYMFESVVNIADLLGLEEIYLGEE